MLLLKLGVLLALGRELLGRLSVAGLLRFKLLAEAGQLAVQLFLGFVERRHSFLLLGSEGGDNGLLCLKIRLRNEGVLL